MSSQVAYSPPDSPPQSQPLAVPLTRPRRRARPYLLGVLTLLLIWVVSGGVLLFSPTVLEAVSAVWLKPQPGAVPWNGQDRITLVAMGLTQRTTEPARTDTIMVIDINPPAHRINMLSVPRDLYVNLPGGYMPEKLSIPYSLGGPRLEAYTIERALGIPVDYTVAMKFGGFMRLVDAMGGVTVNVPQELKDPTYPCLVGYAYCPIDIKQGTQRMDGKTALEFVRERHAFAQQDLARVKDQQAFSDAVKRTLITPSTWPRYPQILTTLRDAILTSMPLNALPVVAANMVTTPRSRLDHEYMNVQNGIVRPDVSTDGQDILLPANSTVIPSLVRRLFSDGTIATERAPVMVLNGTPTSGIASDVQTTLAGLGYTTVGNGNADRSDYARSVVIENTARTGPADYTARRLQRVMDATLVKQSLPDQTARIVVIVGKDFPTA